MTSIIVKINYLIKFLFILKCRTILLKFRTILFHYYSLWILKRITTIEKLKIDYRYAKEVTKAVRYITFSTIGFSTVAVVFSGLTFLSVSYVYFIYLSYSVYIILNRLRKNLIEDIKLKMRAFYFINTLINNKICTCNTHTT